MKKQKHSAIEDLEFEFIIPKFNKELKSITKEDVEKMVFHLKKGGGAFVEEVDGLTLSELFDKVQTMIKAIHDKMYIPRNPDGSYTYTEEIEDKLTEREILYLRLSHALKSLI